MTFETDLIIQIFRLSPEDILYLQVDLRLTESMVDSIYSILRWEKGSIPCLQNYEILGILGAGGYGFVAKAMDLQKNELVAIKFSYQPGYLQGEARVLGRLKRRGYQGGAQLREYIQLDEMDILITDFIEGTDLELLYREFLICVQFANITNRTQPARLQRPKHHQLVYTTGVNRG